MDNQIINELLKRGFGSMNKNDYEVLIFHILCNLDKNDPNSIRDMSSYNISKQLRIPESKVKRLLYEADLYYPPKKISHKDELMELLKCVHLQKDEKSIKFAIRKKILRQYLADVLAKGNRFMDSSFNSEIVTISITDLVYLFETLFRDDAKRWIDDAKMRTKKDKDFPITISDILIAVAKKACNKLVGCAGDRIVNYSIDEINKFINSYKIKQP